MSGRVPLAARTPGTPSTIMSPDHHPWTQLRLGAGTPDAPPAPRSLTGGSTCLRTSAPSPRLSAPEYAADPRRPQGRSSSLRCGRSTSTPTAVPPPRHREPERGQNNPETTTDPQIFTGVPTTDQGTDG